MMCKRMIVTITPIMVLLFSLQIFGQDNSGKAFGRPIVQPTTEVSTAPGYGVSTVDIQDWEAITHIDFVLTETEIKLLVFVGIFKTNPDEYREGEYVNAWVDWNGDKVFEASEQIMDEFQVPIEDDTVLRSLVFSVTAPILEDAVACTWMRVELGYGHDPLPVDHWTYGSVRDFDLTPPDIKIKIVKPKDNIIVIAGKEITYIAATEPSGSEHCIRWELVEDKYATVTEGEGPIFRTTFTETGVKKIRAYLETRPEVSDEITSWAFKTPTGGGTLGDVLDSYPPPIVAAAAASSTSTTDSLNLSDSTFQTNQIISAQQQKGQKKATISVKATGIETSKFDPVEFARTQITKGTKKLFHNMVDSGTDAVKGPIKNLINIATEEAIEQAKVWNDAALELALDDRRSQLNSAIDTIGGNLVTNGDSLLEEKIFGQTVEYKNIFDMSSLKASSHAQIVLSPRLKFNLTSYDINWKADLPRLAKQGHVRPKELIDTLVLTPEMKIRLLKLVEKVDKEKRKNDFLSLYFRPEYELIGPDRGRIDYSFGATITLIK